MADEMASVREDLRQGIALGTIDPQSVNISDLMADTLTQRDALRVALRRIVDRHVGEPRNALYGRPGTMEQRCKECNKPCPCPSWKTAQDALQAATG